uniref:histidine kinase n=1 Tax=Candidatus Kentrum sp. FW TaxID=2126338 RepID=A0A450SCQ1_9GAMM|nr:MAG: Signal transduction histidine kinase [Candidatus Kentron sp. FW]
MVMRRHKPGEEANNIDPIGASQHTHPSPNPAAQPNIPTTQTSPPLEVIPPWQDWAGHPTLLLVDDETDFLNTTRLHWKTHYRDNFTLHTLDPDKEDPVTWIAERLDWKKKLDAVYLDRNMPSRYGHGEEILARLRQEVSASRYLPVVIVTAFPVEKTEDAATALAAGAQRLMYKHSPTFLFEAALTVGQLRDAAEDEMWIDLTQEVAKRIAQRESPKEIMRRIVDFFQTHFEATDCRGRVLQQDGTLESIIHIEEPIRVPRRLDPQNIPPFLQLVLDSHAESKVDRYDSLSAGDVGQYDSLLEHRALVASLTYGQKRLGTLTVYRDPESRAFRPKDEHFLLHLAMQLGALIGSEREQTEIRNRQTELLESIRTVGDQDDETILDKEEIILDSLVERLHRDIQSDNNRDAKTTIRLLEQGTGSIPRRKHLGIPYQKELERTRDMTIYNKKAAYAHVIETRKSLRGGAIPPEGPFLPTVEGINSYLTVPLLASNLCLGAVNMEHRQRDYYSPEDQAYAEALCRVAAEFLLRIRARKFQIGLLRLVNLVAKPSGGADDLITEAVRLLSEFTGFVRLFYLEPIPGNPDAPWSALQVYLPDGKQADEEETEHWREHVRKNWANTFTRKTLKNPSKKVQYTETPGEFIVDIEGIEDIKAKAQAVLPIFSPDSPDEPVALLSLRFRVKGALNQFQQELLSHFGVFLGELIIRGREMRHMFDEVYVARVQGRVGMAFSQFRHSLVTQTGAIGNALNKLRRTGIDTKYVERIQAVLDEIEQSIARARISAKVPDFSRKDITAIWNEHVENMKPLAERKGISLIPRNEPVSWETDTDLVGNIFFHLIQNAIQHCREGDQVSITATVVEETMRIEVRDTGPGVTPDIIPKLFDSGTTTRSEGSGFGLYFSRLLAGELGGRLEFDSQYKKGACFRLVLPKNPRTVLAKKGRSL